MNYAEQLRDPRWQKKRLEIMSRDGFRCRLCSSKTKTLNVHHNYYEPGQLPWEYEDSAFFTLCEDCHRDEEAEKNHLDRILAKAFRMAGATNDEMRQAYKAMVTIIGDAQSQEYAAVVIDALTEVAESIKQKRASK